MPTEQQVLDALRAIKDPETQRDIVTMGLVRDLAIEANQVSLTLAFTSQPPSTKATMHSMATRLVGQLPGVSAGAVVVALRTWNRSASDVAGTIG